MAIKITSAKKGDLKDILSLYEKYFQELSSYEKKCISFLAIKKVLKAKVAKSFENKNILFLVAKHNEKIVGLAIGEIKKSFFYYTTSRIGFIDDIFLEPTYRKAGLGKKFFKQLLNWFRFKKVIQIELEVGAKNLPGLEFWKKLNFQSNKIRMERKI